ncbi:unnamed protein product [Darwinula stevensoni]|nr:unnamed protein product [Darwinula stevensoni]CAG0882920.1 unnamed protein product [Darwinula stevensoni]
MGGGRQQFLDFVPEDQRVRACYREDRRNLIATWANHKVSLNASFMYLETTEDLERLDPARTDYVMGLFDMNHMSYEVDRNKTAQGQPHLATMTQKAIEMLQRGPKGYFLMVEGGRIDHGLHDNKAHRAIQETLAFEEAVRIAMELTSPKDTLIVVTADHDHVMTINGYPKRGNDILGERLFHRRFGVASNGEVDGLPYTTLMFTTGGSYDYKCTKILDYGGNILGVLPLRKNISDTDTRDTEYRQLSGVWNRYGGETHGGQDVPLYAQGPGAHLFTGLQEQSYIAHAISYSACMGPHKKDCLAGQNPKHPAKPFTSGTSPFHEAQHAPHLLSLSIVSLVTFYGL